MFPVHPPRPIGGIPRGYFADQAVPAYRCLGAATAAIGIYGQFIDVTAIGPPASWMNVHTLFGAAMYCAITARFLAAGGRNDGNPAVASDLSRHVSRLTYSLLYGLVGIRIGMSLEWQPNAIIGDAFQPYLAHGVLALLLIRIEAVVLAKYSRRPFSDNGQPVRQKTS